MPDDADVADSNITAFINNSLTANSKALRPQKHPDFDGENCVDCGDKMVPERLAFGRVRCTLCQTEIERRQQQRCAA